MANRSQGATAAAAAAGDDNNNDIICLDGTEAITDDDFNAMFTYTPTTSEILDALKSTKIVGKMDVKKRTLASVGIRASILEKLNDDDKKAFEVALPLKKVGQQHELKLSNTAAVSTSWFTVSDILGRLVSDDSKWPYSTTASNELRSKLVAASKQFKDAVEAAKTQVLSEKQAKVKAASVKLSLSELPTTVGYGQGDWVVPADPANGRCAFCKHVSIDTPKDAAQRQQRNVDKTLQYAAAKKAFEEAKASNPGATRESAKGGKTSRAPPKPTMEPLTARCCCRAFHRVKNGSDEGTTCPILCVNQDTQEAYKDDGPDGTECPYCRCQCAAAYDVSIFLFYICVCVVSLHVDGAFFALPQSQLTDDPRFALFILVSSPTNQTDDQDAHHCRIPRAFPGWEGPIDDGPQHGHPKFGRRSRRHLVQRSICRSQKCGSSSSFPDCQPIPSRTAARDCPTPGRNRGYWHRQDDGDGPAPSLAAGSSSDYCAERPYQCVSTSGR